MTDSKPYKDTLNLPRTEFPMKASLATREPSMLSRWQDQNIYHKMIDKRKSNTPFILHDGPPYANGPIHLGHALNKILKDIIVKSKSLSGHYTPYVPGWDCHGLPIELNVEKKHGKAGHKLSEKDFRQKCRDYAASQVKIQKESFIRLGVFAEWEKPYLTMEHAYEAGIIRSLAKMIDKGHLVQGFKPVYWCYACRSSLAEAEVEYRDKQSPSIDVAFKALDPAKIADLFGSAPIAEVNIPIWTTTPWTLPANEAVCLHPTLSYALLSSGEQHFIIASDLVQSVSERYALIDPKIIAEIPGAKLEGILLKHPFYEKEVPIVLGEHVTTEAGTGAVHTAPSHGEDDYQIGQKYQLPLEQLVDEGGIYTADVEFFAGEFVLKANQKIIDQLKDRGVLLSHVPYDHSYPHCWRHKTPILFRATPQWFISMDRNHLRVMSLEAIKKVQWIPEWGQARIEGMIANRPDWCVSRQRHWCMPMPLLIHREKQTLHPKIVDYLEAVAMRVEEKGLEAWYELDPKDLLGDESEQYYQSKDTLDVWFDSGISHHAVLGMRDHLHAPADLYLEGSDQHRGWFNSSLLTSVGMYDRAPYKAVLTHGFVVDSQGHKMSKSLGNVVTPEQIIQQFGADILRLWVSATDYKSELPYSDEMIKRVSDTYRRIRNTVRYLLSNLFDFNPSEDLLDPGAMLPLDQLAVARAAAVQAEICESYENYQFHLVYQALHHFCSIDMGSFYLDVIKDRQYTCQKRSIARRSCQSAMYQILRGMLSWIAPILSFTAEEAWQYLPARTENSVFLANWHSFPSISNQSFNWETFLQLREWVNIAMEQARVTGLIRSSLDAIVSIQLSDDLYRQFSPVSDELRFLFICSEVKLSKLNGSGSHAIEVIASQEAKCPRCWHKRSDIGQDPKHPELCGRCINNVSGDGEIRQFA